jgi:hypothetical protein
VIESPLLKRCWVRKLFFRSKPPRTGFFRRGSIPWTSAARPCRSSGHDPPPSCVAPNLTPWETRIPQGWTTASDRLALALKLKLKLKLFTTCTVCAGFSPKVRMRRLLSLGPPNYAIQGTYKSGLDREPPMSYLSKCGRGFHSPPGRV